MNPRELKTITHTSSNIVIDVAPGGNFEYSITSTYNFAGAVAITANGAPLNGTTVRLICDFTGTSNYLEGSNNMTILGTVLPGELASKKFTVDATYDGSWEVYFTPDWKQNSTVTTEHVQDDAITTAKVLDANITTDKIANNDVTLGKMAQMAADGFIGNDSGGAANPQHLTVAEARTLLSQTVTMIGNVTASTTSEDSAGDTELDTTIANDVITTSMLKDSNKIRYEMFYGFLNCVSGGATAEAQIKVPWNCFVREAVVSVVDAVSHNVDLTLTDHGGANSLLKTNKTITTGNAANFLLNIYNPTDIDSYPTDSNNLFNAGQTIKIGSDAGASTPTTGKLFWQIAVQRIN